MAETEDQVEEIRNLFLEYANSLDFKLCFQDFDKELKELPGQYSMPSGRLILAKEGKKMIGCAGLRMLEPEICEMKRLYVKPEFRRRGIGRGLAELVIEEAKKIGYHRMRLDTVSTMHEAIALYRSLGFKEISPYRLNPLEGATYFELILI